MDEYPCKFTCKCNKKEISFIPWEIFKIINFNVIWWNIYNSYLVIVVVIIAAAAAAVAAAPTLQLFEQIIIYISKLNNLLTSRFMQVCIIDGNSNIWRALIDLNRAWTCSISGSIRWIVYIRNIQRQTIWLQHFIGAKCCCPGFLIWK